MKQRIKWFLRTEPESGEATSRLTRLQTYRAEPLLVPCNAENCMGLRNISSIVNNPSHIKDGQDIKWNSQRNNSVTAVEKS